MYILLVASTEKELAPFIKMVDKQQFREPEILIAGVGMPVFSYSLMKRLAADRPDLIIGAGIAGSFSSNLLPGELLLVTNDCFADIGAGEDNAFEDVFTLKLDEPDRFPYVKGSIPCNYPLDDLDTGIRKGRGITVNHIRTDSAVNEFRKKYYHADIESQEGAALHYICNMENIPFIHLRAVSNVVGDRNKLNWKFKEACDNLATGTAELITRLVKIF